MQKALDVASSRKDSVFLAGGTDLLVQIKHGKTQPVQVIDVKGIREMDDLEVSGDEFSIGALTCIRTLETASSVREKIPLLAEASSKLGSVQIRYRATIGGNLCNASPSADMAPALLALDAKVLIFGKSGPRVVELAKFFLGPGATVLEDNELLTRLTIPLTRKRRGSVYYKLSTRKAMDLAFVGVAVLLEVGEDDRITKARIALGAVAPTPMRVPSAESRLEGRVPSLDAVWESAALAAESCSPISDLRASAEYRREMVRELCERAIRTAYRQATSMTEGKNQ